MEDNNSSIQNRLLDIIHDAPNIFFAILNRSDLVLARSKKIKYLLTAKPLYGYCWELMVGYSGTRKLGKACYKGRVES